MPVRGLGLTRLLALPDCNVVSRAPPCLGLYSYKMYQRISAIARQIFARFSALGIRPKIAFSISKSDFPPCCIYKAGSEVNVTWINHTPIPKRVHKPKLNFSAILVIFLEDLMKISLAVLEILRARKKNFKKWKKTRCAERAKTPPRLLYCRRKRGGAVCRVKIYRIKPLDLRNVSGNAKVIVDRMRINAIIKPLLEGHALPISSMFGQYQWTDSWVILLTVRTNDRQQRSHDSALSEL